MNVLLRITGYAFRYRTQMLAAWGSLIAATVFYLAVPRFIGSAIDGLNESISTDRLLWLGGLVIGAMALRGVFQYLDHYLSEAISQRVAYAIRNAFYDKLQQMSFAFYDREHTGNLMSKATVDVEVVRRFISMGLIRMVQMVLLIVGAAVMMLTTHWQLGLISLFFAPIIGFQAVSVSVRMRGIWRRAQAEMGQMTTIMQENLAGQRVVKAFGAEDYETEKFSDQIERVYGSTYEAQRLQASNNAAIQFIFWSSVAAILWVGARFAASGAVSIGQITEFILYTSLLVQPIRRLGFQVNIFARAISAGERVFEVLDAKSPVSERPSAKPLANVRGDLAFEGVTFGYADQPALHDIALRVPAGRVVALLGSPGSGKTTLVHLLARFYDVNDGRIAIDGVDIRDVTLQSLRRAIGIVQQDVFLFSATVRDNIAYGLESASLDDVVAAAKTAQIHDEIMALPNGYDTMIGERGMTMSGGQRQRLAIARTLLLDPPILVLDDSLSSVDAGTEALIQQAMENVVKGRTTFIIAHRLSSIQHADEVIVLDRGRIVEQGPPHELLAKDSVYRHTAELQYAIQTNGHSAPTTIRQAPQGGLA